MNEENFKEKCETFLVNAFTPEGNPYMKDVEVASSGSIWSPTDGIHYWPDMSLDFYAYAPLSVFDGDNAPGSSLSYGGGNGKSISFSYTVPTSSDGTTDAEAQPDIMFAHTICSQGGTNESGVVPLEFAHALAGVKFVTKDITKATVKSITLKNLYGEGICVYNSGEDADDKRTGSFEWTYLDEKNKSYSQTFNVQVEDEQTEEQLITDKKLEATFMLIPQALDGVEIEVLLETENGVKMVAGTLSSPTMSWEAGKIYTYAISSSSINWEYVFDVTQTLEIAQGVTSKKYEVTSYRYRIGDPDVKEAVAWTAKWNEGTETDLENKIPTPVTVADVIADFTYEGNGSNTGDAVFYDMELTRTKMHTTYGGDVKLQIAQEKGTPENPYDLSTEGGAMSQTTANCYVVNAPGTYKLPLVFGNAIEKGSPNSAAYNNSAFVDYKGKPINNPYIKNVSGAPRDATLVWSDGFYMFEDVHLEGDYLVFSLNKDFMQQANGVVAVRDESGAIMWSWHIWVTERNVLTEGIHQLQDWKDGTMNAYGLMQCNLGWVDGKMVYYNQRDFSFTFTQAGTGTEKVMTVEQSGATFDYKDVGSTYYQWGRKDPLVALRNWNAVGRDDYRLHETGSPEYVYTVDQNDKASVNMAIQHPNVYYTRNGDVTTWIESGFTPKLWDGEAGSTYIAKDNLKNKRTSIKTIYDPSPKGFKVPPPQAFSVFCGR